MRAFPLTVKWLTARLVDLQMTAEVDTPGSAPNAAITNEARPETLAPRLWARGGVLPQVPLHSLKLPVLMHVMQRIAPKALVARLVPRTREIATD